MLLQPEEHIKVWLLRTSITKARNVIRSFWHRNRSLWEDYLSGLPFQEPEDKELVEAVLSLPASYRAAVYLYYYEDYSVAEIADILHITESAVKSRLFRGRCFMLPVAAYLP